MDLITLDSRNQPAKLIENYDSLIWTERFNTVGDFQIKTGNVDEYLEMLPEGTMLSLRESNVAMVVETLQIDRKKNSAHFLTITGRSFESILDRRVSIQSIAAVTGSANWTVNALSPSDVAYYITRKICVDGLLTANDIFEPAVVQFPTPVDYLTGTGPNRAFDVSRGSLLSTVLGLLQVESKADPSTSPASPAVAPHGIRAVRPNAAGTAVGIEFYPGRDRTAAVYFDATRDLLDDGTYLWSKIGSANVGYGLLQNISSTRFKGTTEPTGLARRVILVDGTTSGIGTADILNAQIDSSLGTAHETALFDGSVNQDLSPYVYGDPVNGYILGDIVKVVGDYGLTESCRVTEYIRSEDATGSKQYPTLTTLPDL